MEYAKHIDVELDLSIKEIIISVDKGQLIIEKVIDTESNELDPNDYTLMLVEKDK